MFTLPDERYGRKWQLVVDTHNPNEPALSYEGGLHDHRPVPQLPHAHERQKPKKPMGL